MRETENQTVADTVTLSSEGLVVLPGSAETPLTNWSQAPTCPGGRADDAIVNLVAADGTYVGRLTLGWFRANTTLALMEEAEREVRREEAVGLTPMDDGIEAFLADDEEETDHVG